MSGFGWMDLVLCVLATWRLTNLFNREAGPANLLGRIRLSIGSISDVGQEGSLAELLTCHYCLSVWMAALVILGAWVYAFPLVVILAVSAGSVVIHEGLDLLISYKIDEADLPEDP